MGGPASNCGAPRWPSTCPPRAHAPVTEEWLMVGPAVGGGFGQGTTRVPGPRRRAGGGWCAAAGGGGGRQPAQARAQNPYPPPPPTARRTTHPKRQAGGARLGRPPLAQRVPAGESGGTAGLGRSPPPPPSPGRPPCLDAPPRQGTLGGGGARRPPSPTPHHTHPHWLAGGVPTRKKKKNGPHLRKCRGGLWGEQLWRRGACGVSSSSSGGGSCILVEGRGWLAVAWWRLGSGGWAPTGVAPAGSLAPAGWGGPPFFPRGIIPCYDGASGGRGHPMIARRPLINGEEGDPCVGEWCANFAPLGAAGHEAGAEWGRRSAPPLPGVERRQGRGGRETCGRPAAPSVLSPPPPGAYPCWASSS